MVIYEDRACGKEKLSFGGWRGGVGRYEIGMRG